MQVKVQSALSTKVSRATSVFHTEGGGGGGDVPSPKVRSPPKKILQINSKKDFKAKNTHDSNVAVGLQAKIQIVPRAQQNSNNGRLYQLGMNHAW